MGQKENFLRAARELMDDPFPPSTAVAPDSAEPVSPGLFTREAAPRRTVLAEGTVIRGSVRSNGGVELRGELHGDITAREDLLLSGRLEGNAAGGDIRLSGGRIKGDLQSEGLVRIDGSSVVLGNIRAGTLMLNGSVKGDLEVRETAALETKAAVAGSVTAGRLSIAEGAMLQGEVRISAADLGKRFAEEPDTNP